MTTSLRAHRIRLACNQDSHVSMQDALTTQVPLIWRGTSVNVEIGLFVGTTIIDTKSNIANLYLEIHATPRSTAPLVQKSIAGSALDVTVTSQQWTAGTHQNTTITLASADTQFDLAGASDEKRTFWMVIHIVDTSGNKITCGGGQITVEEDGAQNDLAVVPQTVPAFRISDGNLELYNPDTATWHAVYVKGAAGQERLAIAGGAA